MKQKDLEKKNWQENIENIWRTKKLEKKIWKKKTLENKPCKRKSFEKKKPLNKKTKLFRKKKDPFFFLKNKTKHQSHLK